MFYTEEHCWALKQRHNIPEASSHLTLWNNVSL